MNQVSGDQLVQLDGRIRAVVKVDGVEVNHMMFASNQTRDANRWLV